MHIYNPRLEFLHWSGVLLTERVPPLCITGAQFMPPHPPSYIATITACNGTEGFERGLNMRRGVSLLYRQRIFSQSGYIQTYYITLGAMYVCIYIHIYITVLQSLLGLIVRLFNCQINIFFLFCICICIIFY